MTEYPMVVDLWELIPDMVGPLIHSGMLFLQVGLALYLLVSGLRRIRAAETRTFAVLRLVLAVLLLMPFALGAHVAFSLVACAAAFGLLVFAEKGPADRGRFRRFMHGAAIGAALVVLGFGLWEREDPFELGVEVLTTAMDWREDEIQWQTRADATAPKLGELAPDFELKDPDGATAVRLADFRGKRPVALIFGSYT